MVLWIMWGALLSSVVVYLVVLHLTGSEVAENSPVDKNLVKILSGVALGSIIVSAMIRWKITLPMVRKSTPETLSRVLPSCIVSWALAESVAIFGLVLGFMGEPISTFGVFFIASFGTLVCLTPNFSLSLGSDLR